MTPFLVITDICVCAYTFVCIYTHTNKWKYRIMTFWVCLVLLVCIWLQDWPTIWYWITNWGVHPWGRLISLSQQSVFWKSGSLTELEAHWDTGSSHLCLSTLGLQTCATSTLLGTELSSSRLTSMHFAEWVHSPAPQVSSWRSKQESGISWGLILVAAAESRP